MQRGVDNKALHAGQGCVVHHRPEEKCTVNAWAKAAPMGPKSQDWPGIPTHYLALLTGDLAETRPVIARAAFLRGASANASTH
jgi:hypothetical protein